MKEYFSTYSKEHVFILDEDGDNYSSFDKAIDIIKKNIHPLKKNIKHDFFDGGSGFFIKDDIKVKIICSNWDGTELRVNEYINKEDLDKVRKWAREIYNEIHKKEK